MKNNKEAILILDQNPSDYTCKDGERLYTIQFEAFGQPLEVNVIARGMATLTDIVPLAYHISDRICEINLEQNRQEGKRIPCQAGCSACCQYFVPLSILETMYYWEKVFCDSKYNQSLLLRSFVMNAKKILHRRPPKSFDALSHNPQQVQILSSWFKQIKYRCPFLCNQRCLVYEHRTVACREHIIAGSPLGCASKRGVATVLEPPVTMLPVLTKFAARLLGQEEETVPMPFIPFWREQNQELFKQTWPATEMVELFIEIFEQQLAEQQSELCTVT